MSAGFLAMAHALRDALATFDPALWSGDDCAAAAEELAATEKACASARARAAARAGECGVHRRKGFTDAADWLARAAGTSTVEAKSAMDTARALREMPDTQAAVASGELSLAQAGEVVKAEAECPGSEADLLAVAKSGSLKALKERARKCRLEAIDPEELHARQQQARSFRHWRTDLGMVGFVGELPPEVGLPFVRRLDAETDRLRRQAKRERQAEGREALAADAFVRLVAGSGKGKTRSTDLVVVCDLRAYRRGHAHPGEPCHLVGGGPIPVSVARELADDAFVKAVVHDGVRIETVAHLGRHMKAELRTALELGAPPGFEGIACTESDCDRRHHLQWDHRNPVANRGPTSYENLKPLCWPHHQEKTERDRKAGLLRTAKQGPDPP